MKEIDYMNFCINLAKKAQEIDEVPVGAIVVDYKNSENPKIIGQGFNMRETKNSPTAHAELIAIEQAAKNLNS